MRSLIEVQRKLLPDILAVMQKRYQILRSISFVEPIGRRTLAQMLGMSERVLRGEVEFLKNQKLIDIKPSGMSITKMGAGLLQDLESMMREISGINETEEKLKKALGLEDVVVVPGNSDEEPWVKSELGRACAYRIKAVLMGNNIIAVTGGSTMAAVADALTPDFSAPEQLLFVPARGGIGEDVQNQANTICAKMAERTGGKHRVLYVPDQVSLEVYKSVVNEPSIKEVLTLIKQAEIVLHGIGEAITMAKRRKTGKEEMEKIIQGHAVGEAFGYYFNEQGEVVHKVQTIGLQLEDLQYIQHVFAVAGGASKAKAIKAYMNSKPKSTVLITDEGAAKNILACS
ncbi:sugar-binding transcriptional regulator [Weizmannia acidilactici]|uniref:sugar-binding transcriptional regulator n=1 Tax=Weizmannia acidilactici TaxID=2607726 RepID=UPI00124E9F4F|nr:sugar-binding transcriptional regulator [Weizmannia acidilactici]GER65934.1 transcriptional regulator [Weizmannia acidilactici]GER74390.1 transcriptional regulator [Weizmannia acidilactici]